MRKILLILALMLSMTSFGQNKVKVITLTDIHVNNIEGDSYSFMEYKDSSGALNSDLRFENYDVYVDGLILFQHDDDILVYFDEDYAKSLVGKKLTMVYYEKDTKYYGNVTYVVELKTR